jgi:hypothetical protein
MVSVGTRQNAMIAASAVTITAKPMIMNSSVRPTGA